jgi:hypothetical protein
MEMRIEILKEEFKFAWCQFGDRLTRALTVQLSRQLVSDSIELGPQGRRAV